VGADDGIYASAWAPACTDGWHGWWRIQNGTTTWGM